MDTNQTNDVLFRGFPPPKLSIKLPPAHAQASPHPPSGKDGAVATKVTMVFDRCRSRETRPRRAVITACGIVHRLSLSPPSCVRQRPLSFDLSLLVAPTF